MQARDFIPGVPAAGHIAANGYWHPGPARTCSKSPCEGERMKAVDYVVIRERGGARQKWANCPTRQSADDIANAGNAKQDGWTYTVHEIGRY